MNENEILRCGEYLTDDEYIASKGWMDLRSYIRIRIISYEGNLYFHKMIDGECTECKLIGRSL
jgi:hypothetical protein